MEATTIQPITTEDQYINYCERFEQIQDATTGPEHAEKMQLVEAIGKYENDLWDNVPDMQNATGTDTEKFGK